MEMAFGDILDRFSIVKLKTERTEDKPFQEYELYKKEFNSMKERYPQLNLDLLFDILYRTNGIVWDLEGAIRNAQLDDNLMEAGRRAVLIRKVNGVRVATKNLANNLTGQGFIEIRHQDHLSR